MAQLSPRLIPPSASRRPRRVSVTMAERVYRALEVRATLEGRSLSNLAAYLLEAEMAAGDHNECY